MKKTKALEKDDPENSVSLYRNAIKSIRSLDSLGPKAVASRTVRYPVNRLSLTLERQKRFEEALNVISKYEDTPDHYGIVSSDEESIAKRKVRLAAKLQKV